MCPVSHIHGLTDAGVLDKNVSHSKDIKLAKAPFRYSPCMSMGKICADLVSQNCFLYSPQNTREHPGSCACRAYGNLRRRNRHLRLPVRPEPRRRCPSCVRKSTWCVLVAPGPRAGPVSRGSGEGNTAFCAPVTG